LVHIAKKREVTIKAGEMICTYLELKPELFLKNRASGEPTIVDNCDPVQFMIPTPKTSHVIKTMDKNLCMEILRWVIPASFQKVKDHQEIIYLKKNQLQPLYHFLIEDMLWLEHELDFEDYKQTVMSHEILDEGDYALVKMIDETDQEIHNVLADRLSDNSE
jgi:hypothetical protein